jgi:hypothetical protein
MLTMQAEGQVQLHRLPAPLEQYCWQTTALLPIKNAILSAGWTVVDPAKDAVYRDDIIRTGGLLRGAVKCDRLGETITVRWNGTVIGFSGIPQGDGTEVEVSIDNSAPQIIQLTQKDSSHKYARFFYLPEQPSAEHTAVLRVKTLPSGVSFYAGQMLVVGTLTPTHLTK